MPPGTIIPFAGPVEPAGYLPCDGSSYQQATYPALFAAIGTTWGNGPGPATFQVPDLRGRTVTGNDGALQGVNISLGDYFGGDLNPESVDNTGGGSTVDVAGWDGGAALNNVRPSAGVLWLIKT